MQAYLLYDFKVEIDPRTAEIGGCWQGKPRDGIPTVWGMDELRFFYERTLEYEQPVILDIGANAGAFSILTAMNPRMRSYAFEPTPLTYEILKKNISLNRLANYVKTFQIALSDKNGKVILKYPKSGKDSGLACIGEPLRFDEWIEFKVETRCLDDFATEHGIEKVDLIKIDTEGCELFVLKGAEELIKKCSPGIFCEYNETNAKQFGYHPSEITKLLASYGYRHIWVSHEDVFFYIPNTVDVTERKSAWLPCLADKVDDVHRACPGTTCDDHDGRASFSESPKEGTVLTERKREKTIYKTLLQDYLQEYVDCNPSKLPTVLRELCDANRVWEALSVIGYALEKYPDSPDLYNLQAELKVEIGDSAGAKEVLFSLVRRWPYHAKALGNLGVILALERNTEDALSYFARSLEVHPYDKNTVCNCAIAALDVQDVSKAAEFVDKYLDKFPNDTEVQRLSRKIEGTIGSQRDNVQSIRLVSQPNDAPKNTIKIIMTSGDLKRYNGGSKIYTLWTKLLRKNGFDAYIATQDGSYEKWLVKHEPVISYRDVEDFRSKGNEMRVLSGWLDTPGLERLIADGQFYYFDAELRWTLHFRNKLDYYLNKGKIADISTHSRYIQSWYMANYGIKPFLINEWSDKSVFFEDSSKRIQERIGCMRDSEDQEAFDFLEGKCKASGECEIIRVSGNEKIVADLLRTVDIFVGLNPGKHPFWGEGCPRTQQESLHCGCVLIAFDCLGNREYLYDNWTGLMVPSGDIEALWKAVKFLIENPEIKEQLRTNGKSIADGLFSEKNKYKLVSSFLGLGDDPKTERTDWISKAELSSIFPRPFWLAEEEIPFLARKAADAGNTIVEIGCAYGGSTTLFLLNKRKNVRVYSIDPFIPDSKGGVRATIQDCRDAVAQALVKKDCREAFKDWHLINNYSYDVVGSWNKEIDLLFIDGSHHYEDVKRDFQQWSKFVSKDGKILIHDSRKDNIAEDPEDNTFSRGWMGPTRLVEELKSCSDFELVDTCYSISVFVRKTNALVER